MRHVASRHWGSVCQSDRSAPCPKLSSNHPDWTGHPLYHTLKLPKLKQPRPYVEPLGLESRLESTGNAAEAQLCSLGR